MLHGDADADIVLGDNGIFVYDDAASPALATLDIVRTRDVALGGPDTITGDDGKDLVLAGRGGDTVSGGGQEDIVFGDFAEVLVAGSLVDMLESIDRTEGGADLLSGDGQDDLIVGGAAGDSIDGGANDDLIFGDAVLDRTGGRGRHRPAVPGPDRDPDLRRRRRADSDPARRPATSAARTARPFRRGPSTRSRPVPLGGPGASPDGSFGNDYIAGGADNDMIFGQLGNDTIQGDGSIDRARPAAGGRAVDPVTDA